MKSDISGRQKVEPIFKYFSALHLFQNFTYARYIYQQNLQQYLFFFNCIFMVENILGVNMYLSIKWKFVKCQSRSVLIYTFTLSCQNTPSLWYSWLRAMPSLLMSQLIRSTPGNICIWSFCTKHGLPDAGLCWSRPQTGQVSLRRKNKNPLKLYNA